MPGALLYQLITLDVYSALFDVEGSLAPILGEVIESHAESADLVRTWRQKQMEYALIGNSLARGRVSFRVITRRALDYALGRAGLDPTEAVRQHLVEQWDRLTLWPEAAEVLTKVKARGYRVGLLSNGDEAMLQALAARLPIAFDDIFSSEQAGYYKPHPSVYALPLHALGLSPDQILHVAGSATDVMGAKAAGLRCAWSNRKHDKVLDPMYSADHEFDDLRGLLDLL